VIPGGYAPDLMRRQPAMVQLVRQAFERGKIVATICHAGWMLVSADVVRDRKATCFYSIKDDLINAGADYVDAEVVRDGNLITSRQPDYLARAVRSARLLPDHHRGVEGIAPRPRAARGLPGDRLSPVRRPFIFPVRCSRCPASHSHTTTPATAMTA